MQISKSQLYNKLKASTNLSISGFTNKIRVEEAKKLIVNSSLSISEISYKLGFNTPSYFTKIFKKYTGISPIEYKNGDSIKEEINIQE